MVDYMAAKTLVPLLGEMTPGALVLMVDVPIVELHQKKRTFRFSVDFLNCLWIFWIFWILKPEIQTVDLKSGLGIFWIFIQRKILRPDFNQYLQR